jgi:small subunit ribosomal protein S4
MYGLLERQFRKYFHEAERKKGITGEVLLQLIECRLDTMVFRMGFAPNRRRARQIIRHGHIVVNGREVNLPSFGSKGGDLIEVKESSRDIPEIADSLAKSEHRGIPAWVEVDVASFKGKVLHVPSREEMQIPVQEQLIVELYSK